MLSAEAEALLAEIQKDPDHEVFGNSFDDAIIGELVEAGKVEPCGAIMGGPRRDGRPSCGVIYRLVG